MGFLKLGLIAGLLLSWIAALAQGTFSVRSARATVDRGGGQCSACIFSSCKKMITMQRDLVRTMIPS